MQTYTKFGITVRDKPCNKSRDELLKEALQLIKETDFSNMIKNFRKAQALTFKQ